MQFERQPSGGTNRAVILSAEQSGPAQRPVLDRLRAAGWLVFMHAWRPAAPLPDLADLDVAVCSHEAGPPVCWCRKPIPGSVIEFAMRRDVDLFRSVVIGDSAADRTMAERIGARVGTLENLE